MKFLRATIKVCCALIAAAVVAVLIEPQLLSTFDSRYHAKGPHGMQDPGLVGLWVGGDREYPAVLILKEDGRMSSGWRLPGLRHTGSGTLNLDAMSWCGAANDGAPGSRAVTYALRWTSKDRFALSVQGVSPNPSLHLGTWRRVDPASTAFQAEVLEGMEDSESLKSASIADALCSEGYWKREDYFAPYE